MVIVAVLGKLVVNMATLLTVAVHMAENAAHLAGHVSVCGLVVPIGFIITYNRRAWECELPLCLLNAWLT